MRPQTGYSISRRIYFENKYFKEPEKYKFFYCFARCTRLGALSEIAIEINHLHIHRTHKSQNCVRVVVRVKYLQATCFENNCDISSNNLGGNI